MTQLTTETITYSKTHLVISDEITFEEWQTAVETFARLGDCWQWWLGDLLAFGEGRWGEMYAQALDSTEMSYGTLRNLKWVSNSFPPHRRREGLSWTHHREIAGVDNKKKQDQLLKLCESKDFSVKKLKKHLAKETEGMLGEAKTVENNGAEDNCLLEETIDESEQKFDFLNGEDSEPIPSDAATETPHIDLTDTTTKRNFDKTIDMLDNILRLRIPNMYLKGTAIHQMTIELRDALMEAGDG